MKIRKGFVSNSSSSSFIVVQSEFPPAYRKQGFFERFCQYIVSFWKQKSPAKEDVVIATVTSDGEVGECDKCKQIHPLSDCWFNEGYGTGLKHLCDKCYEEQL